MQKVMAATLAKLAHKVAIQLHLMAESHIIFSSRSRWPVQKLMDTPSYVRQRDERNDTRRAHLTLYTLVSKVKLQLYCA